MKCRLQTKMLFEALSAGATTYLLRRYGKCYAILVSEPLSMLFSKYEHFQKYIKESNISIIDYAPCLPLGHC